MIDEKIALIKIKLGHLSIQRDPDTYVRGLIDLCSQVVDAERCTVYVVDRDHNELRARNPHRPGGAMRMLIGQGLAGLAALTGETINVPDAYADPRFDQRADVQSGFRTVNTLVVPVWGATGRPVAVIQASNKRDGAFERRDQMLLEQVAMNVGPMLERLRPG